MNKWTNDELDKIGEATELRISTMRNDESLRKEVIIWVIRNDNKLYVRAVGGIEGKWYRHAMELQMGRIQAGGVEKDVNFSVVEDPEILAEIDTAYKNKYHSYGDSIVGSTLTPNARQATLMLSPK